MQDLFNPILVPTWSILHMPSLSISHSQNHQKGLSVFEKGENLQ